MGVVIRQASEADAAAMAEIYEPIVRETPISFEYAPPGVEEFADRVRYYKADYLWLLCEIDGAVAGYAYAVPFRPRLAYQWTAESSVYVGEAFRRRGVGRGLYASLFECLKLMGIVNLFAGITLPNAASVAIHESFGFTPVGVSHDIGFKFGRWHDVGWWEALLTERKSPPAPLRTVEELSATAEWAAALKRGSDEVSNVVA